MELVLSRFLERHASWAFQVRVHDFGGTVCLSVSEKWRHSFRQRRIQVTLYFSVCSRSHRSILKLAG